MRIRREILGEEMKKIDVLGMILVGVILILMFVVVIFD
jgi:hypothetical protein